jgi:hypothetical protein
MDFDPTPFGGLYTPPPSSQYQRYRVGGRGAYTAQCSTHAALREAVRLCLTASEPYLSLSSNDVHLLTRSCKPLRHNGFRVLVCRIVQHFATINLFTARLPRVPAVLPQ